MKLRYIRVSRDHPVIRGEAWPDELPCEDMPFRSGKFQDEVSMYLGFRLFSEAR